MIYERLEQGAYLGCPRQYRSKLPSGGEHMAFGNLQQTFFHPRREDYALQSCANFQEID
jgi:hypothetical protein